MRVDARNKSGEDFFKTTFCYPTQKNVLMKIKCEKSTRFQYLYEYFDFLEISMKANHVQMIEFNHRGR